MLEGGIDKALANRDHIDRYLVLVLDSLDELTESKVAVNLPLAPKGILYAIRLASSDSAGEGGSDKANMLIAELIEPKRKSSIDIS